MWAQPAEAMHLITHTVPETAHPREQLFLLLHAGTAAGTDALQEKLWLG